MAATTQRAKAVGEQGPNGGDLYRCFIKKSYTTPDLPPGPSSSIPVLWLGIKVMKDPTHGGTVIIDSSDGSPAKEAGLKPGDRIHKVNLTAMKKGMTVKHVAEVLNVNHDTVLIVERWPGGAANIDFNGTLSRVTSTNKALKSAMSYPELSTNQADIQHAGYLKKQARGKSTFTMRNWKSRFFVLDKTGRLNYYDSENTYLRKLKPLNAQPYEVTNCTIELTDPQNLKFTIVPESWMGGEADIVLEALSNNEYQAWTNALKAMSRKSLNSPELPPSLVTSQSEDSHHSGGRAEAVNQWSDGDTQWYGMPRSESLNRFRRSPTPDTQQQESTSSPPPMPPPRPPRPSQQSSGGHVDSMPTRPMPVEGSRSMYEFRHSPGAGTTTGGRLATAEEEHSSDEEAHEDVTRYTTSSHDPQLDAKQDMLEFLRLSQLDSFAPSLGQMGVHTVGDIRRLDDRQWHALQSSSDESQVKQLRRQAGIPFDPEDARSHSKPTPQRRQSNTEAWNMVNQLQEELAALKAQNEALKQRTGQASLQPVEAEAVPRRGFPSRIPTAEVVTSIAIDPSAAEAVPTANEVTGVITFSLRSQSLGASIMWNHGVEVTHVDPEGPAYNGGMEVGDYIVEVNGERIPFGMTEQELAVRFATLPRPMSIGFVRRNEAPQFVQTIAEADETVYPQPPVLMVQGCPTGGMNGKYVRDLENIINMAPRYRKEGGAYYIYKGPEGKWIFTRHEIQMRDGQGDFRSEQAIESPHLPTFWVSLTTHNTEYGMLVHLPVTRRDSLGNDIEDDGN